MIIFAYALNFSARSIVNMGLAKRAGGSAGNSNKNVIFVWNFAIPQYTFIKINTTAPYDYQIGMIEPYVIQSDD